MCEESTPASLFNRETIDSNVVVSTDKLGGLLSISKSDVRWKCTSSFIFMDCRVIGSHGGGAPK